jgi:hypothetical protein
LQVLAAFHLLTHFLLLAEEEVADLKMLMVPLLAIFGIPEILMGSEVLAAALTTTGNANCQAGSATFGGGSGGCIDTSQNAIGGAGGSGLVIITWVQQ